MSGLDRRAALLGLETGDQPRADVGALDVSD